MAIRGQFGVTLDERRAKTREYVKNNRQDWAELGFRLVSALVHDDDRDYLLADIEHMKANRLVLLAESKTASFEKLLTLARRNITTTPTEDEYATVLKRMEGHEDATIIKAHIENSKRYLAKLKGLDSSYSLAKDEEKRVHMAARAVAYSATCFAYYRLAFVLVNREPSTPRRVFNLGTTDDNDQATG